MWVPVHKYCDLKVRETRIILIQRDFSFFCFSHNYLLYVCQIAKDFTSCD